MRKNRNNDQAREISFIPGFLPNADGSCLVSYGNTKVICSASIEETVPFFLRNQGTGWVTAEYGMLPGSGDQRVKREASQGKQSGRTMEIQRLIGRSLRAIIDLKKLGERQIIIDCDVINADGGTRTASISGAYVALELAIDKLLAKKAIRSNPITGQVAAISCGIINNQLLADLDYQEDSKADVDANIVMNSKLELIETQASAENKCFSLDQLVGLVELAQENIKRILILQLESLTKFK